MKIGIVTYHRSHNYGALLQAIATRYILEKEGHEVYYVDYWPEYHRQMYAFFSFNRLYSRGIVSGFKYLKSFMKSFKTRWKKTQKSKTFISHYIDPHVKPVTDIFDVIVYGSDQIWRKQNALKDYNPIYFGRNDFNANKHIALSASMGVLPINSTDRSRIKELTNSLDAISVRENDLQQMLVEIGIPEVYHTLDPTLLVSAFQWDEILRIRESDESTEKYVLYYRLYNAFDVNKIRNFAYRHGLKIKILTNTGLYDGNGTLVSISDPCDFVRLIKNASVVFSSSFHGLVFSIIYKKPVYVSFSKNQGRAESLLNILGMNNCMLPPLSRIPSEIPLINYASVYKKLKKKQMDTEDFIQGKISVADES